MSTVNFDRYGRPSGVPHAVLDGPAPGLKPGLDVRGTGKDPGSETIPALTGFRGFAALIVLLNHAGEFAGLKETWAVRYGYFGVPCFFCLSGMLFAFLYFDVAKASPEFLRSYYSARFARIFPVYWMVLAVFALTVPIVDWKSLGWHLVMGHGFFEKYRHDINVPMWTLPVEVAFYLLAPWLFVAMRRVRAGRVGSGPTSIHWIDTASIGVASLLLLGIGAGFHQLAPADADWWKGTLFGRFPQFGLGVLSGLLLLGCRSGVIRWPRWAGDAMTVAAIGLLVVQTVALDRFEAGTPHGASRLAVFALKLSFAPTACLLILAACQPSWWQRLLSTRPMLYLGAISYALYLTQCASAGSVDVLSGTLTQRFLAAGWSPWPTALAAMAVCIGVAAAVHHGFEIPVQRWLRRALGVGRNR